MSGVPKAKGVTDFLFQPETGRCYYYDLVLHEQNPSMVKVQRDDPRVVAYFAEVDRKYAAVNAPAAEEPIVDLTPQIVAAPTTTTA